MYLGKNPHQPIKERQFMELKSIELSRLIYLTMIKRDRGQVYWPGAALELVRRYQFRKAPGTHEELSANPIRFEMGVFEDIGIQELNIYSDGLVIASRSNTTVLEAFVTDLFAWASDEFGIVEAVMPTDARLYESQLVVGLDVNQTKLMPWAAPFQKRLSKTLSDYGQRPFEFGFGGVGLTVDQTKAAGPYPGFFKLEPRVGIPIESNIYFSVAPLKTDDHVALLREFERLYPA